MGKARIISQIEPGRYKIELDNGTLKRDDRIAEINFLLQGEQLALLEATATIIELQNQLNAKVAALNVLINELNNPPDPDPNSDPEGEEGDEVEEVLDISERVNAAVVEVEQDRRTLDRAERQKSDLIMKGAELRLRKANLEKLETDAVIEAWCTDGEPDMSGEVGTAEVPGEPLMPILIKPGFGGGAVYDQARDGQMIERLLMSGAQAYLNAALLPGWQRWKPTYRFGAITAIDRDAGTCSIQLEPTRSSAQNLVINPSGMIHGVKAKYQDCDMDVFEEGDEVLIEMQSKSWAEPLVIGFKSDPRPCALDFYFVAAARILGPPADVAMSIGATKPPDLRDSGSISAQGFGPYFNQMCIYDRLPWVWYAIITPTLRFNGDDLISEPNSLGVPGVAATKNHIWSVYIDGTNFPGVMVFTKHNPDGSTAATYTRSNSYYAGSCFAASGMADMVVFTFNNGNAGGNRLDFICRDDEGVSARDVAGDFDVPRSGHGWGDQRVEVHAFGGIASRSVRLYNGTSPNGITILTEDEEISGCAMQKDYILVGLRSGLLKLYDRKSLGLLITKSIASTACGMVTVDAARMPASS
jgi:hypothetical protein